MLDLTQPVDGLKGVGETVASKLARLGIFTVGDLVRHYPRRYDDFSQVVPIRRMRPGPVTVRGIVQSVGSRRSQRRYLTITEAIISDDTGTVKAVWFNQPYLKTSILTGAEVYVSGRLEFKSGDLALQSPAIEPVDRENKDTARIVPVYPETKGLSSKQLRGLIQSLLSQVRELPETLPEAVVKNEQLMPHGQALAEVHYPSSQPTLASARLRLAFEELFFPILTSLVIKREIRTETGPQIQPDIARLKKFVASLPFKLTDAQRKAAWQIIQDMNRPLPMNRLLEGDVGSGKTIVALMAAVAAISGGYQVALMVPTDILARQHAAKLTELLARQDIQPALLLGQMPATAKKQVVAGLTGGSIRLVIGTHALLTEQVTFDKLGLVVIDEQHRFGVNQRTALKQKAGHLPHLLSMTATPIPRSLALTVYGDLDVSVIDQLPPGRTPIITKLAAAAGRDKLYEEIDHQISDGRQVFVVCPLIDPSDALGARSATAEAERLQTSIFKHRRIGVIHGRLKPADKEAVMTDFVAGQLDILVATSVVEVGVDVPNATVMVVESAERFGLASLHQLRGRVGRGAHQSYCYLITSDDTVEPERLRAVERTTDGFRLAQIDLELRGPGQIYGVRQHGALELDLADIGDTKFVARVRAAADAFTEAGGDMLQYPLVLERINRLKAVTTLD